MSKSANSVIELNKIDFDSTNNRINFTVPISTNNQTIADQISSTSSQANAAFNQANAAFASANNVAPQIQPAFNTANAAFNTANAAYTRANNSLDANTGGTVTGDIISTGIIRSAQSTGDEGGQIELSKPVSNTSLSGNVTIDVYQNKVRIFDGAGTNRGVFIDIANTTANGVGSEVTKYDANTTSTGFLSLPNGTTAQRPANPQAGSFRYNTTNKTVETYTGSQWVTVVSDSFTLSMLAVGAGGGGGGNDGPAGAGGGSGGAATGELTVGSGTVLQIYVGTGGVGGTGCVAGGGQGSGGLPGGGPGGPSGGSGCSGGGGGGGGWSGVWSSGGITTGFYYIIAGGGAGGGGGNEGSANDVPAYGGGVQPGGTNGTSLTGGTGAGYGGDGGGSGGGGGGRYGGAGGNNGSASGGGNYAAGPGVVNGATVNGNYGNPSGGSGGAAATVSFTGYASNYGAGSPNQTTGQDGIVILRYPGSSARATGGSISSSAGYVFHTFTANGTFTVT